MSDVSFSDIIRKYISDKHQADSNYFSTKTSFERNQDFKIFCENDKHLNFRKHRSLFTQLLDKQKELLNLNPSRAVVQKTEKFKVGGKGQQQAEVTATKTQTTPIPENQGAQPVQSQQDTNTQNNPQQPQTLHPPMCRCNNCLMQRGEMQPLDPEEAGGILEIIIDFWHSRNPNVELMTEAEVLRVGKRLAPILERHLGGDILLYGMGAIAVAQIIMKRVDQARKANQKDEINEKVKEAGNAEKYEKILESQKDMEITEESKPRKFFSTKKLKEIEAMGDEEND